jgi:hypothetical protein
MWLCFYTAVDPTGHAYGYKTNNVTCLIKTYPLNWVYLRRERKFKFGWLHALSYNQLFLAQ